MSEWILLYVAFCTTMTISRQKKARRRDYTLLFSNDLFIVHSTIDNTAHTNPLNSLEHCICTTPMTNIRPGRDSNPVPNSLSISSRNQNEWVKTLLAIPNDNNASMKNNCSE